MFPFSGITNLILQTLLNSSESGFVLLLLGAVLLLVNLQYKRMAQNSQRLLDLPPEPVWPITLMATFFGVIGGFLGSYLLIIVGISVFEVGIMYLWVAAIGLMLIQQRFLCFAYAGGLIALSNIIFGFPRISIPHVMGLVAILHLVEALLIFFSGHLNAFPIYVRTPSGQLAGGFNLQKFWPLPMAALTVWILPNDEVLRNAVDMPQWWPLIKTELYRGVEGVAYTIMPFVVALGYGDIAIIESPKRKTRRAALELGLYSMVLLILAVYAGREPMLALLPALFGPLGHEFLIHLGQRREMGGTPIYKAPERGIMILHLLGNSPLKKLGLKGGDILLTLEGVEVNDEYQVRGILLEAGKNLEIEYLSGPRRKYHKSVLQRDEGETLGFVPVPQWYENSYVEVRGSFSLLSRWWKRWKNR